MDFLRFFVIFLFIFVLKNELKLDLKSEIFILKNEFKIGLKKVKKNPND